MPKEALGFTSQPGKRDPRGPAGPGSERRESAGEHDPRGPAGPGSEQGGSAGET